MLQDLSYEKNDEIAAIAEIEQKLIQSGILKKSIVPKIYLHLASKEQLKKILNRYICLIMLLLYLLCICIFLKIFVDNIYLNNNCLGK